MKLYRNTKTGQILTEGEARQQWRQDGHGDDLTDALGFYQVYEGTKRAENAITYVENMIATHEPTASYKYMLLDRLRADCEYYLGNGNRNAAALWGHSVQSHLESMRVLYESFPEDARPEWLTADDLEYYALQMGGVTLDAITLQARPAVLELMRTIKALPEDKQAEAVKMALEYLEERKNPQRRTPTD